MPYHQCISRTALSESNRSQNNPELFQLYKMLKEAKINLFLGIYTYMVKLVLTKTRPVMISMRKAE